MWPRNSSFRVQELILGQIRTNSKVNDLGQKLLLFTLTIMRPDKSPKLSTDQILDLFPKGTPLMWISYLYLF